MALVLTIPGVVDSQDLHSLHPEPDGVSFTRAFDANETAMKIMSAHERGEPFELVVLTLDSGNMALDDVYVASASYTGGSSPLFEFSLQARAVRWV